MGECQKDLRKFAKYFVVGFMPLVDAAQKSSRKNPLQ